MRNDRDGSSARSGRCGMKRSMGAAALAIALALAASAAAQVYPSRPITLINPFPPGGATDLLARTLAEHMKGSLGQPIDRKSVV